SLMAKKRLETGESGMRLRALVLCLASAAALYGQRKFSWQNYCFDHPGSVVCRGNDYAVKPQPKEKDNPRKAITNPMAPPPQTARPSVTEVGQIDWRFADPAADALVGINFGKLAVSTLAYNLVVQLASRKGLSEEDIRKIFVGMAVVDQAALSVHNSRVVALVTGSVTESTLPTLEAGLKAVALPGGSMLAGHADAVDQAMARIALKTAPSELTNAAAERQAKNEFWATGSAALIGPQAVSAGVKQFSLTASIQETLTTDLALELDGAPAANTLQTWQAKFPSAIMDGNTLHIHSSLDTGEAQQKFAEIADGPLGQPLAS